MFPRDLRVAALSPSLSRSFYFHFCHFYHFPPLFSPLHSFQFRPSQFLPFQRISKRHQRCIESSTSSSGGEARAKRTPEAFSLRPRRRTGIQRSAPRRPCLPIAGASYPIYAATASSLPSSSLPPPFSKQRLRVRGGSKARTQKTSFQTMLQGRAPSS